MFQMDSKIEDAANLSLENIEKSLPPSLFNELSNAGECMSVSWLGLLAGSITPMQYGMNYSYVKLEHSDWVEPTILWPLLHSPSGTRKSVIHRFVRGLNRFGKDENNEENEDHISYQVIELLSSLLSI